MQTVVGNVIFLSDISMCTTRSVDKNPSKSAANQSARWVARAGIGAFIFFTVKGLAWLVLAALAGWGLLSW